MCYLSNLPIWICGLMCYQSNLFEYADLCAIRVIYLFRLMRIPQKIGMEQLRRLSLIAPRNKWKEFFSSQMFYIIGIERITSKLLTCCQESWWKVKLGMDSFTLAPAQARSSPASWFCLEKECPLDWELEPSRWLKADNQTESGLGTLTLPIP